MSDREYNRKSLIEWYDQRSEEYDALSYAQTDERYGGDFFRMELVAREMARLKPAKVLDVGCGTGEPMMRLLDLGIETHGFDLSPGMIAVAKRKLAGRGLPETDAEVGDILDPNIFDRYPPHSYDAVIANGVMPYIKDYDTAHKHLLRLVKPGGYYLSAYSNALLDLFTLNRFTLSFLRDRLVSASGVPQEIIEDISSLLTNSDKPKSIPAGARDQIFVTSHNPFEVEQDLSKAGFSTLKKLYYKFHAFPPLLANTPDRQKLLFDLSRKLEIELSEDWRGMFMASTFIIVARNTE